MNGPWKEVLLALLIGAVVGWFAHQKLGHEWMPAKGPRMLEHFSRELKLTPEQKEKVRAIMDNKRQQLKAVKDTIQPQLDQIRSSSKNEIRGVLNEEQKTKLQKMEAKWEAKKQKFRAKHSY